MSDQVVWLSERYQWFRLEGRPVMERDFAQIMDMDAYATNEKLRSTGYEFLYPDWRSGLVVVAEWYRERGLW